MPRQPKPERIRSTSARRVCTERFALIRDAFLRCQDAFRAGFYIESISIIESIVADRLGSLLYGITRIRVEQDHTIGNLLYAWQEELKKPRVVSNKARPLPDDIASFLNRDLARWVKARNRAVHATAKLERPGDSTFHERYAQLERVAANGFLILTRLDTFDLREKESVGRIPATFPDALAIAPDVQVRVNIAAPAS